MTTVWYWKVNKKSTNSTWIENHIYMYVYVYYTNHIYVCMYVCLKYERKIESQAHASYRGLISCWHWWPSLTFDLEVLLLEDQVCSSVFQRGWQCFWCSPFSVSPADPRTCWLPLACLTHGGSASRWSSASSRDPEGCRCPSAGSCCSLPTCLVLSRHLQKAPKRGWKYPASSWPRWE